MTEKDQPNARIVKTELDLTVFYLFLLSAMFYENLIHCLLDDLFCKSSHNENGDYRMYGSYLLSFYM